MNYTPVLPYREILLKKSCDALLINYKQLTYDERDSLADI